MRVRSEEVDEQVDRVLPRRLMLTFHKDVEQQLKYLIDVMRVQQLFIHTIIINNNNNTKIYNAHM